MIKRNLLKRCATLLLACGMIFGFTACGNPGSDDNGSGGSVQSGNEYEGTKKDKFTGDGKLIVEYFGVDMDTLQSRSDDTQLIMDTIENKFQVSFKIMNGSASSWKTQLNQYIGGGDVPDPWYGGHQDFLDTLKVIERVTPRLLSIVSQGGLRS